MTKVEAIVYRRLKKKHPTWTNKQLIIGVKYALAPYMRRRKNVRTQT